MANDLLYPFGAADSQALTATGAQALTITDNVTILDGVTVEATGNRTINLTISALLKAGALIHLASKTNGTETTIFGTGFTAPTITGEAGKTYTQSFNYNGTTFYPVGNYVKVD
jgi:hypothetical protein